MSICSVVRGSLLTRIRERIMENGKDFKHVIGITGGMGSGKSTVSRFLSAYMRLQLVDIDEVCRKLLKKEQPGWQMLRRHLASSFFFPDGSLDRRVLRGVIFNDTALRETVNSLLHPLALVEMRSAVAASVQHVVLVDVPLLYEAGWGNHFSRSIVVYAGQATCCRRIMARDSIAADDAARSISAQMHSAEKALLGDHVINNSGCWLLTRLQAVHLARLLQIDFPGSKFSQESA